MRHHRNFAPSPTSRVRAYMWAHTCKQQVIVVDDFVVDDYAQSRFCWRCFRGVINDLDLSEVCVRVAGGGPAGVGSPPRFGKTNALVNFKSFCVAAARPWTRSRLRFTPCIPVLSIP